jgi:hypothetical protein
MCLEGRRLVNGVDSMGEMFEGIREFDWGRLVSSVTGVDFWSCT